ncbi:uncharacterized protein DC041_0002508 [Schistosoma bovis]|uniref:Uncharacterized protein n=1 Tax=Schistosoma bovis TaxID=6184 RepID=A0A430PXD1_SCHBO|nr:uncharacterized protein DC041_0002508 [Schistosoma bovis]
MASMMNVSINMAMQSMALLLQSLRSSYYSCIGWGKRSFL